MPPRSRRRGPRRCCPSPRLFPRSPARRRRALRCPRSLRSARLPRRPHPSGSSPLPTARSFR
ncbi:hypothetical protein E3O68_01820 [Cryobacterium sp. TMB3-1-2]|nr:hypothetical protein E3O60_15240 [Cryobacterium sp. TMB1-7]TFC58089.1 hypothetical protein E3O68_01820 [Cryobacterium sp. TMB3-1-2]TFC71256.1 hypothetical protein E3T21_08490 [Cryobacterium sp. TMB3-15]TFC79362.1 hypothetical protein E3T22_01590 [Cryobacterium sp. TMB3-10]TFC90333.1 hypothetical protein E3T19_06135 [Cryobacterium sp. TMT4-31]TFD38066.1 hypothetical protein E3T58_17810 [Cryobacterium sp. TMB3-12]